MTNEAVRVLVTGSSGFLGSNILLALLDRHPEWHISALDIKPPRPELRPRLDRVFEVDIRSASNVHGVFSADYLPGLIVHTAGIIPARGLRYSTHQADWEKVKAINYDGTRNVLDAALAAGCRRFVYTSSCTVVADDLDHDYHHMDERVPLGLPTLHYGRSKGMAEQYVLDPAHQEKGLLACALRPTTIIGEDDIAVIGVMHDLIAKRETSFVVGDGDNIYDFMYISNAVDAHVLAVENLLSSATAAGHAFFISNAEPCYFWDFLAFVWAQFGHYPAYRVRIPGGLAWFVAVTLEGLTWLTGTASTLDRNSVKDGIRTSYSNIEKAREILGFEPEVGLAEGVRRSCEVCSVKCNPLWSSC